MNVQAEYEIAAKTILCDCGCHPQSVFDCACVRAAEMRDEVRALVEQGKTGEAVIAAYVAKYGEKIRIAPTSQGFNLLAWAGPGLGILTAALLVALLLRRWKAKAALDPSVPPPAPLDPADPYAARLDAAMKELDR